MVALTHSEAILFRMLSGFFGGDNIAYNMSVTSVCGGELPERYEQQGEVMWARADAYRCLFTILNAQSEPKLVVEFEPDFEEAIDMQRIEFAPLLEPILKACDIRYLSISQEEFQLLTGLSDDAIDFTSYLEHKLGLTTV